MFELPKIIMKNKYLLVLIGIIAVGAVYLLSNGGFNRGLRSTDNNKVQASASFYPLYFFSSEIGKDKVDVTSITPAGVEPHDYDPTAQDIAVIQKSKLLIVNGAGFEPWLENIKDDLGNVTVVNTSDGISLQEGVEDEHEGEEAQEHEDEEHISDPHIWLSPVLAKSQVDKIQQGFITADPNNTSTYEANGANLKQRLDALDMKFKKGLSSCKQKSFVTSHAAFGYLAREYNLTQVPISGISPDEEPSLAELAEVTKFVRDNNVKYIFFETLVSPKLSETIASETGAKTLVLDPIEGLSDDDIAQGKNYFTVMENNLKNLQTALECSK